MFETNHNASSNPHVTPPPKAKRMPSAKKKDPAKIERYELDELSLLLDILPLNLRANLPQHRTAQLIEIVLDLGRLPEARYNDGTFEELGKTLVSEELLQELTRHIGEFNTDNRAGIPRTLHRISCIRNRVGKIVGLTCRVGRVVLGTVSPIADLIAQGKSILLLGRPGVGKTTKLREMARLYANTHQKRVVIVDTSNEIAGDGDIAHPVVGRARRMQVPNPLAQESIMIEAVENHTPEVIVIDEIGTEAEARAARTIAERGVILIATAHGNKLENLIKNPTISDLIGGIQSVTLGDEEARRRMTQKTVLEREKQPTFDVCIEIQDRNTLAVYTDVAKAVDGMLRGFAVHPELRRLDEETGETKVLFTNITSLQDPVDPKHSLPTPSRNELQDLGKEKALSSWAGKECFKVYLYAITRSFVDNVLQRLQLEQQVVITQQLHEADVVLALRGHARPGAKILRMAQDYELPVFYAKTNTLPQIQKTLRESFENTQKGEVLLDCLADMTEQQSPLLAWTDSLEA